MSEFKKAITKGITTINMKTNSFVEQNKSKTYISTLQDEIGALKSKVGEVIYDNWKAGSVNLEDVEKYLTAISEKEVLVKEQEERIKEIQMQEQQILGTEANNNNSNSNHIFCSMCGAQNEKGYKFCIKCGKEL